MILICSARREPVAASSAITDMHLVASAHKAAQIQGVKDDLLLDLLLLLLRLLC